jgi:ABC-type phosphate transport system substrate-binding protein
LDGKISLEQLRGIYTGKIKDWKEINQRLDSLPIQPIAPTEPEAIEQFKKLVLQNDDNINRFNDTVKTQDTGTTQRQIREEFSKKGKTGIISFGIFSKTWRQCSISPLTISSNSTQAVQPLFILANKRAINPSDNFCGKDTYLDIETFHTNGRINYPLGYPLYVVYPKDNSLKSAGLNFAAMLKTQQGQCLLNKVGLVPLQPMPNDINYACKSVPQP